MCIRDRDQAGWTRRLTTGKSLGMTMGGKRNYGDEGNDYIASPVSYTHLDVYKRQVLL